MALKPARLQWSEDGSALESRDFGDVYFQSGRGVDESRYVFLQQNRLPGRFAALEPGDAFHIAELGFGSGLNFLLTAELWKARAPPDARLTYVSIEKHPIAKEDLARIYAAWPELKAEADDILAQYPPMIEGFHHVHFPRRNMHLILLFGDVADMLPELSGRFDAWYLDGFAPKKNPAMWDAALFPLIAARTKPGGTLSTFSAVGDVRRGLKAAGFIVKKEKGHAHKWHMTVAALPGAVQEKNNVKTVTVLGAGLAGCSVACALAQKGLRVTVIDRHEAQANETSGNPVGILYPQLMIDPSPASLFYSHGFCYTRALLTTLKLPSWTPCGVLNLDLDEEEKERSRAIVEKNGYPPDFARAVSNGTDIAGVNISQTGLYEQTAGYLSPREFCAALLDHPNIETVFTRDVGELKFDSDAVVIALGTSSGGFPETKWMPLQYLRGQISYAPQTETSRHIKTVLCHDGFITPPVNGLHYIGATFQREAGATDVREEDHAENLAKLKQHIPSLDISDVTGGRAGVRVTTPDKLPVIGPCPDYKAFVTAHAGLRHGKNVSDKNAYVPKLYIAAAFGAHGISSAPLAGEIIACDITGDPAPVPQSIIAPLMPERFILRDLKRNKI